MLHVRIILVCLWGFAAMGMLRTSSAQAHDAQGKMPLDRALAALGLERADLAPRAARVFSGPPSEPFQRWSVSPLKAPAEAQALSSALLEKTVRPAAWLQHLARFGPGSAPAKPPAPEMGNARIPVNLPEPLATTVGELLSALEAAGRLLHDMEAAQPGRPEQTVQVPPTPGLFEAGHLLIDALSQAKERLQRWEEREAFTRTLRFASEAGAIVVGGSGPDRHAADAALVIELGGNDRYLGAVASGRDGRSALLLDLGGDDVYLGERRTQGAGFGGVGILWDVAGDDLYRAGQEAQGAARAGIGLLIDGGGDDQYIGGRFVQGAAAKGIAGLIDRTGNDTYQCRLEGQAFAGPGGLAVLSDVAGNDLYLAGRGAPDPREPDMDQSFAQGFGRGRRGGLPGGLGLLADGAGRDLYACLYFGQGAGIWGGVGILYDARGKDTYAARRYAQGAGIHYGIGLLLDAAGNDQTLSWGVSQGSGHDGGLGILLNEAGDDLYIADWLSGGAAQAGGRGILVDNGGSDTYQAGRRCPPTGAPEPPPGIGLLLDAAGKDRHTPCGGENTLWIRAPWWAALDEEAAGRSGLALALPPKSPGSLGGAGLSRRREIRALRQRLEQAEELPPAEAAEALFQIALHWGFEKDLPARARERLFSMDPQITVPVLIRRLDSAHPLARRLLSAFFSVHAHDALPALHRLLHAGEAGLRAEALAMLGRLGDPNAVPAALEALKAPEPRVRAAALEALGRLLDPAQTRFRENLGRLLREPEPASALAAALADPRQGRRLLALCARAMSMAYDDYRRFSRSLELREPQGIKAIADFAAGHRAALLGWLLDSEPGYEPAGRALRDITQALADGEAELREAAVRCLSRLEAAPALPALAGVALEDADLAVREEASSALARFGDRSLEILLDRLQGLRSLEVIRALHTVGRLGTPRAREALKGFTRDPDPLIRRTARWLLTPGETIFHRWK